jgi:hypothetical protein
MHGPLNIRFLNFGMIILLVAHSAVFYLYVFLDKQNFQEKLDQAAINY